jgi:AcrR family transcriptional regulator
MAAIGKVRRVDRRRARTRQQLVTAGRRLIAAKGVAGLRVQEITQEADVALGSFYNYFATKDDLVEAVVAESLAELAATTVPADGTERDPAVITAQATRRVVRLAFEDPGFAQLLVNLNHAETLFAGAMHPYAREVVARGVAQGRFQTPDPEVSVNLIVGGTLSLIRGILAGEHAEGVEAAHAEVSLRALGIPGDEARAIALATDPVSRVSSRR